MEITLTRNISHCRVFNCVLLYRMFGTALSRVHFVVGIRTKNKIPHMKLTQNNSPIHIGFFVTQLLTSLILFHFPVDPTWSE